MGQAPRTSRSAVADADNPEQIREHIEETRQELGETVEALAAKTDVKAQAKRKVEETKSSVVEKKDELVSKARNASPDGAGEAVSQVPEMAQRNPLPLTAAGAFLAGIVTGRLTKRRQQKQEGWRWPLK